MKAVRLTIKNIGIIENTVIDLNKPLILFFGDLRQGKTTILNAFKWCLGGSFPSDIIRHGEKEASVSFEFMEDSGPGSICRSWYKNKEGVTTVRPVSFIRAGKPVSKPDGEIKKFLNPYLLDSDYLKKMGETERKAYFVGLFGVDTSDIDKEIATAADQAKTLRIEIKAYGEIDTTPVEPVDATTLKAEKQAITDAHNAKVEEHRKAVEAINAGYQKECDDAAAKNREAAGRTDNRKRANSAIAEIVGKIDELEKQIADLKVKRENWDKWLAENPELPIAPIPPRPVLPVAPITPDTSALDAKISEAGAVAVRVEQYQKNLKRADEKAGKQKQLSDLEESQRELKKKKVARLAETSEKSGIKGLQFNEDGSFSFDGTADAMLSTSQIMALSQELSALYPAGFGLDLIDRAESLGFGMNKNILEFVEKAKREEKTILATIVGERPAEHPPEVGVFVVEKGSVK